MAFKKRRVWTSQPQEVVRPNPDWEDGLLSLYNGGSGFVDLASQRLFTLAGSQGVEVGSDGYAARGNAASKYGYVDSTLVSVDTATVLAVVSHATPDTDKRAYSAAWNGATGDYLAIGTGQAGNESKCRVVTVAAGIAGTTTTNTTATVFDGGVHCIALRWTRLVGTQSFVDGQVDAFAANTTNNPLKINRFTVSALGRSTFAMHWGGLVYIGATFAGRFMSDEDLKYLTENPRELFAPRSKLIGGAAGGGGTDVGLSAETDTSLALSALQIKATGQASETDTAIALAGVAVSATGRADETDAALPLAAVQIAAVGLATETDTALALDAGSASAVGRADEADAAFALSAVQKLLVGIATEADTALALSSSSGLVPGIATETDTAFALAAVQKLVAGAALEVDTALALSTPGGTLDLILKILVNRQELNPATGTFTLYDDDGTTVLYTTNAWADAAGTIPYSGGALRRIDALF